MPNSRARCPSNSSSAAGPVTRTSWPLAAPRDGPIPHPHVPCSAMADVGDRALDLHDPDLLADVERLVVQLGAGRPLVAPHPDAAGGVVHPLADHRGAPDEHRDSVDLLGGAVDQMPLG